MRHAENNTVHTTSELEREMAALDFIEDGNNLLDFALQSQQEVIQPPAVKSKKH